MESKHQSSNYYQRVSSENTWQTPESCITDAVEKERLRYMCDQLETFAAIAIDGRLIDSINLTLEKLRNYAKAYDEPDNP